MHENCLKQANGKKHFLSTTCSFESFTILDCYMSYRVADAGKRKIIPHKPTLDA